MAASCTTATAATRAQLVMPGPLVATWTPATARRSCWLTFTSSSCPEHAAVLWSGDIVYNNKNACNSLLLTLTSLGAAWLHAPPCVLVAAGDCGCPPAYEPVCVGGVTFANACTAACGRRRAAMAYNGPCVEQAAPAMQPASNSVSMQRGGRWGLGWLCLLLSPLAALLNSYD